MWVQLSESKALSWWAGSAGAEEGDGGRGTSESVGKAEKVCLVIYDEQSGERRNAWATGISTSMSARVKRPEFSSYRS